MVTAQAARLGEVTLVVNLLGPLFAKMKVTLTDLRKYPEANEILGERAKDYQVMVFIVLTEQ